MPGQGLAGGLLAFGLAPVVVVVIIPDTHPDIFHFGGGDGIGVRDEFYDKIRDDLKKQRILRDDQEVMDIIVIIVKSGILE